MKYYNIKTVISYEMKPKEIVGLLSVLLAVIAETSLVVK